MHKIVETNSGFHVQQGTTGKVLISVFQEIFASTDQIFISGRGISTRQQFYEFLGFS